MQPITFGRVVGRAAFALGAIACAAKALADVDAPSFDRPGIAFSTSTLAPGTFDWEQGLPDYQRTSHASVKTTQYSADTLFRIGITDQWEIQAGSAIANTMKTRANGSVGAVHGRGDTTAALKIALPSPWASFTWAAKGGVTLTDGDKAFAAAKTGYALGTALNFAINDAITAAFYLNANRADGETTVDISPSLSFTMTKSLAGYVECGANYGSHGINSAIAGGGLTLLVTHAIQIDFSADAGLTSKSPRLAAGAGVSMFFNWR